MTKSPETDDTNPYLPPRYVPVIGSSKPKEGLPHPAATRLPFALLGLFMAIVPPVIVCRIGMEIDGNSDACFVYYALITGFVVMGVALAICAIWGAKHEMKLMKRGIVDPTGMTNTNWAWQLGWWTIGAMCAVFFPVVVMELHRILFRH